MVFPFSPFRRIGCDCTSLGAYIPHQSRWLPLQVGLLADNLGISLSSSDGALVPAPSFLVSCVLKLLRWLI